MHVIVVGAGTVGLCCALELAGRGAKVTLIDRGLVGGENSTRTGGGIRQQFGTALNIKLSLMAAPFWSSFEEKTGIDHLFRATGYLFLAKTEGEADALRSQVELQHSLGVDSVYLSRQDLERRWPALGGRDIVAASFRQNDGWANQQRIIEGLHRAVVKAGVELMVGTEVLSLIEVSGSVKGVMTTVGPVAGDAVTLATGPWCTPLLQPLGLSVPVGAHRHELLIVEPAAPLPADLPWLIGLTDQVHMRPDYPGRALLGGFLGHDEPGSMDGWATRADPEWTRDVLATTARVFGLVDERAVVRHGWAGIYCSTPDRHPIIDRLHPGLYSALGMSGTGLMHAPAVGMLIADLVVDGNMPEEFKGGLAAARFADWMPKAGEKSGF